jgi:hypothetical protein
MARDRDKLTASFETENTGGLLSGFLAEEDVFDRRALWRLGSWGAASVGAVVLAVYANQSSIAVHREQAAVTLDLSRQAQQIQLVAKESKNEARQLASAIETLNGDRDRLFTRVTGLEQGLESVTGTIAKQQAAAASPPAAPASVQTAMTPEPPPATQNPPSVPALSPVATTAPKGTEKAPAPTVSPVATAAPKTADKPSSAGAAPEPAPATVASIAPKPSTPPPATVTPLIAPAPLVAEKSMMAPPDAAATKLTEPEKSEKSGKPDKPEKPAKIFTAAPMPEVMAAASPADNAEPDAPGATAPKLAVQRTEFGVDVGGANSVGGLRALWRGLLKSRSNAALTTLRPIIVIKEGNNGLGMQLRLVAGPLGDAAAAAKICAGLMESERSCETAVFDGQRLAMTADEPPTTDKPVGTKPATLKPSSHGRGTSRRVAVEEPAKKPDPPPSTLSSFFRRSN